MKHYLVALFDLQSYNSIEKVQKNICQKYKIHKNTPTLHIALETIEDPDIDKLYRVISGILKPYKKFKVETSGAICFDPPYKSVNLKIESKGYIIRLARTINDTLKLHGFNVRDNIDNWDLYVSLGNTNYVSRHWSAKEYVAASMDTKKEGLHEMLKVDTIELWKPTNNKKEVIVKSFPLREY